MICRHAMMKLALGLTLTAAGAFGASMDLGGTWRTITLQEKRFPDADEPGWEDHDVAIPLGAAEWACQRRTFRVPQAARGRHLFLRFEGVRYTAEVRVNGTVVGQHKGGYEPFECDITGAANLDGENVLEVLSGSWKQLAADPAAYAEAALSRSGMEILSDQILYPVGSHVRTGIWAPVTLEMRRDLYLEDVTIVPSVRESRLTVRTTVRNLSDRPLPCSVAARVVRGEDALRSLPDANARVPAGGRATVESAVDWSSAPLWWPHDPVLLHVETELSRDAEQIDLARHRFGFREVWADKDMFVLNGTPLHLLGNSAHPLGYTRERAEQVYAQCREANINCFRLHAQPWSKPWYDVADETGMLIIHESAVWCLVHQYALADPRFWTNVADHLRAQVRLHRNRPSVIGWSIENEMLHCGGMRVDGTEQRLAELAGVVRQEDPTRLISYDGDEDPGGAADVINLHYAHRFPTSRLWPRTCWWLDEPYEVQGWPRREWQWDRQKPLYIGEYLWAPSNTPDRYTLFFGDQAYTDMRGYQHLAKGWSWRFQVEAYRAQGLSGGCPWNIFEGGRLSDSPMYRAVKTAYRPQTVIIRQWTHTFFPEQRFTRDLTVINDVLRDAALSVRCALTIGDITLQQHEFQLDMTPAEIVRRTLDFQAPSAPANTTFDIVATIHENGREIFRDVRPCRILSPDDADFDPAGAVALFDPAGQTAEWLADTPWQISRIDSPTAIPSDAKTMIIGEHAIAENPDPDDWQALCRFVDQGGQALVLAQNTMPAGLPVQLHRDGSTIGFIRNREHPITQGLPDSACTFWEPDHILSHRDLTRPDRGAAAVLVDAGGQGLDHVLLMDMPYGKGRFLFSQLLLVQKRTQSPVAQTLLQRCLDTLTTPVQPRTELGLATSDPAVQQALKRAAARTRPLEWKNLARESVVLIDANPTPNTPLDALRSWVNDGGTLWLHRPSAATLERLGVALPGLDWAPASNAPLMLASRTGLAAGLRNEDLYWLSSEQPRRYTPWALSPDITTHQLIHQLDPATAVNIPVQDLDDSDVKISTRREDGLWLATNGTVTADIDLPADGTYVVSVRAGGTPCNDVFASFHVLLDDQTVGGFSAVQEEPKPYTVTMHGAAGPHTLSIRFYNDDNDNGQDRNALIAGVAFSKAAPIPGALRTLTTPAALFETTVGQGRIIVDGIRWHDPGNLNVNKARRLLAGLLTNLHVDTVPLSRGRPVDLTPFTFEPDISHLERRGDFLYLGNTGWVEGPVTIEDAGPMEVIIEAKGTEAQGEFPEIEVRIDGRVVGAKHLLGGGWQDVMLRFEGTPGTHTMRLTFTNDYYDPAAHLDRNLWIRRIALADILD